MLQELHCLEPAPADADAARSLASRRTRWAMAQRSFQLVAGTSGNVRFDPFHPAMPDPAGLSRADLRLQTGVRPRPRHDDTPGARAWGTACVLVFA